MRLLKRFLKGLRQGGCALEAMMNEKKTKNNWLTVQIMCLASTDNAVMYSRQPAHVQWIIMRIQSMYAVDIWPLETLSTTFHQGDVRQTSCQRLHSCDRLYDVITPAALP